ncbi:hypothetical protein NHH03_22025 [Stieleria sp. TO1_6]|uniref:hypothetical protein n=1 Tax=Stieleria tagensis TaxID=2956795 RepID=UPI00209AAF12|nr:hypothetical protein [Stieleria tagensis]MCO8124433.1 hypothetical protein [Stieleria tagensis]
MPAYDIDSQSPEGSFDPDPSDGWVVRLGSVAGIRLFVSCSIFVALAVLTGLVGLVRLRPGNEDLPLITATALAFWCSGWAVQVIVQLCLHFGTHARTESLRIGLLGVEITHPLQRRHPWTAVANLTSTVLSLSALTLFGIGCLSIHLLNRSADLSHWSAWATALSAPGLGFDSLRDCYLTAAWLFWIQAAFQAYPLPHNLGRGAIASSVALFAAEADDEFQLKLLRRMLQLIAVITVVIAMGLLLADANSVLPRWTVLIAVSMWLWISSYADDLEDWITSVHIAGADPITARFREIAAEDDPARDEQASVENVSDPPQTPWISDMIDSVRMRQKRKKALAALMREREEASDEARLDHVLTIVGRQGTEGLSPEDQALLKRVSENLRRRRESESASDDQQ